MSYKSENWKEKLEQVRNHIALKEGSVEKSADEILNDQIEEELNTFEEDVEIVEGNLEEKELARHEILISKVFKTKKPDEIKGIDRLIDMSSMGVVQSMQKQNPKGFLKTVQALGKLKEEVEEVEEVEIEENMSSGDMIKKLFKVRKDQEVNGIANMMNMTDVKVLQKMQKENPKAFLRMVKHMGKLPAMEEVEEKPVEESVEKTTEKLVERNMLGRLAKQLKLNEEGKQKMFAYFEKGELNQ